MKKELRELKRKVAERERFVASVFAFVESVVLKHGKITKSEVHNCNTHVVRELADFNGLTFVWSTGLSMMGGNTINIFFRRSKEENCLVLSIYYQVDYDVSEDYDVQVFDECGDWQKAFAYATKHTVNLLRKRNKALSKAEKAELRVQREEVLAVQLEEKAKKLGLK